MVDTSHKLKLHIDWMEFSYGTCSIFTHVHYGFGDLFVKMVDKKRIYLFQWIQSLDNHTKKLIKPKL
jgi:hypothetical protein